MSTHLEYRIVGSEPVCGECQDTGTVMCVACRFGHDCKSCSGASKARSIIRLDGYFKNMATNEVTKHYFGSPTPGDEEWSQPSESLIHLLHGVLYALAFSNSLTEAMIRLIADLEDHQLEFRIVE